MDISCMSFVRAPHVYAYVCDTSAMAMALMHACTHTLTERAVPYRLTQRRKAQLQQQCRRQQSITVETHPDLNAAAMAKQYA